MTAQQTGPFDLLQRLRAPVPLPRPGERCEMCTAEVADEHGHVVDLENRGLMCACRPCYLLFSSGGAGGKRFRAVPAVLEFPGTEGGYRRELKLLRSFVSGPNPPTSLLAPRRRRAARGSA